MVAARLRGGRRSGRFRLLLWDEWEAWTIGVVLLFRGASRMVPGVDPPLRFSLKNIRYPLVSLVQQPGLTTTLNGMP